jgi:hypothetical protein
MKHKQFSVFEGDKLIAEGDKSLVLKEAKQRFRQDASVMLLFFDDETGRQLDFDLHGIIDTQENEERVSGGKVGPGRPALGIVSREISLLPRHWEWLEKQQPNISATLRRLVDTAMKNESPESKLQQRIQAVDRELWVLAGNKRGAEEASRMLYAKELDRFREIIGDWPSDIADHLCSMLDLED